ncbi:unnamed protein product, partial [marine sediment metagenome]
MTEQKICGNCHFWNEGEGGIATGARPWGNAVCSKLGNKIYPVFYFDLCLIGGVIHVALGGGPVLGASMAVSGIVGMYLPYHVSAAPKATSRPAPSQ